MERTRCSLAQLLFLNFNGYEQKWKKTIWNVKLFPLSPFFAERFPLLLHVSPDIHIYDMANKSVESSKKITRFELAFFNLLFNIRNDFSGEKLHTSDNCFRAT